MKSRMLSLMAAAVLGVALVACGSGADGEGIRGESLPTVVAEQDLRIGSVDDPDYALTTIGDLVVDGVGRIFALHPREQLVRVFSPDGVLEGSIGGPGGGPGEFERPQGMGWVGDTLWVFDQATSSFSLFDQDGGLAREFAVPFEMEGGPGVAGPPRAVELLHDGRIYGEPPAFSRLIVDGDLTHREGFVLDDDGGIRSPILPPVPYGRSTVGLSPPERPTAMTYGTQRFGDPPLSAFVPGEDARILVDRRLPDGAVEPRYSVAKVSFSGDTVFTFRGSPPPVEITQAEVDEALDAWVEPMENFFGTAPAVARELARGALFLPAIRPGVSALLVALNGDIWLKETTPDAPDAMANWLVLSPDGEPAFRVQLPDEVVVVVAGETQAWGSLEDELGVPYLVRYRFERP